MTKLRILLVDDDRNIRRTLLATLKAWGHDVVEADSFEQALTALKAASPGSLDLMLTDVKLGTASGVELIRAARRLDGPPLAVTMTAFASFENAVEAIKEGAYDYLPKPFSNAKLEHVLGRVSEIVALKRENERLRGEAYRTDYFAGQVSPAMLRLEEFVRKVAPTEASVLLTGESGTGKTELARLIHHRSPRAGRAFGVVNCTTLAESLLESELFGHVKGAFTGAVHDHMGKLEAANHGTLLIDEIGELSPAGQTKLLRFLQEKVIERVGGNKAIPLDVRVVAATNRNLEEEVGEGKFREDLYFRLNIFECSLVPLRFRREDLPVLISRFWGELQARLGAQACAIGPVIQKLLVEHAWPGNIRELRNVLERLALLSQGREPEPGDLPEAVRNPPRRGARPGSGTFRTLEEVEREQIEQVLALEKNQERAAQILGITTVTLWRKRKAYGLP